MCVSVSILLYWSQDCCRDTIAKLQKKAVRVYFLLAVISAFQTLVYTLKTTSI